MSKTKSERLTEAEIARRRDEVIKRMLNTPPQPRQQKTRAGKPKERPAQKGRVHRAKSRY